MVMLVEYQKANQRVICVAVVLVDGVCLLKHVSVGSDTWKVAINLANAFPPNPYREKVCVHLG